MMSKLMSNIYLRVLPNKDININSNKIYELKSYLPLETLIDINGAVVSFAWIDKLLFRLILHYLEIILYLMLLS